MCVKFSPHCPWILAFLHPVSSYLHITSSLSCKLNDLRPSHFFFLSLPQGLAQPPTVGVFGSSVASGSCFCLSKERLLSV